jgi:hypothetical protein
MRAEGSTAPANADPSQSSMARLVSVTTGDGKWSNVVSANTSAKRRLTASLPEKCIVNLASHVSWLDIRQN